MSTARLRAPGDVLVHLRRARDHVDRHFTEPLDLASLAAVAGLSKYHRLFKATYGVTPAAYLSRRRVEPPVHSATDECSPSRRRRRG